MQINVNEFQNENNIFLTGNKTESSGKVPYGGMTAEGVFSDAYFSNNNEKTTRVTYDQDFEIAVTDTAVSEEMNSMQVAEAINKLDSMVTPEGYNQMEVLGLAPNEEDVTSTVTIDERIQIELAAYCDDYKGTGHPIASGKIEEVLGTSAGVSAVENNIRQSAESETYDEETLGNEELSRALEMAADIQKNSVPGENEEAKLPDSAKKFLLKNALNPTIKNTYIAVHSGTQNAVNSISDTQWNQMKPQVQKVYEESGIEFDEMAESEGRWMLENDISITKESVSLAHKINNLNLNMTEDELKNFIENTSDAGISPEDAVISREGDIITNAREAMDTINKTSSDDLNYVVKNNNRLTIEALKEAQQAAEKETASKEAGDLAIIKARRVVEEARMVMTVSSCVQIQKLGIDINTTELSNLLEKLLELENSYYKSFFGGQGITADDVMADTLRQSVTAVNTISFSYTYSYVEFVGEAYNSGTKTISSLSMVQMESTYAGVGTEVRKDLGDNINKAFDHIEGLLESLGFEVNEQNKKAARILGYNSMEITEENMEAVKKLSGELEALLDNFSPKVAVKLIKEGINPLNTEISVLNEKLKEVKEDMDKEGASSTEDEKYSRYLCRLDKKGELSEEERKSYIAMYRLLNWVGKNDGNLVGTLYKQGREVNLKNLLSAARSKKVKGIDVSLDDKFGLTETIEKPDDIERDILKTMGGEDIAEYSERILKKSADMLTPDGTEAVFAYNNPGEIIPEQLYDILRNTGNSGKYEYIQRQLENIHNSALVSEDAIGEILQEGITPSVTNILSAGYLYSRENNIFGKIRDMLKDKENGTGISNMKEALESGTEEELQQAFEKMAEEVNEETEAARIEGYQTFEQYSDMIFTKNVMSVMEKMSKNRNYTVEGTVNNSPAIIHLSVDDNALNNKVKIVWTNSVYGEIRTKLTLEDTGIKGSVEAETETGMELAEAVLGKMKENLISAGAMTAEITTMQITTVTTSRITLGEKLARLSPEKSSDKAEDYGEINSSLSGERNKKLYEMAKAVLAAFE